MMEKYAVTVAVAAGLFCAMYNDQKVCEFVKL